MKKIICKSQEEFDKIKRVEADEEVIVEEATLSTQDRIPRRESIV